MKTNAPSATNRLAVANPIPLLPPVMTATLFSSFPAHEGSPYLKLIARAGQRQLPPRARGSSSAKKNVATMSTKLQASEAVSAFR